MFIRKKDYMLLMHRIEYLEDPAGKFKLGDKVVLGCNRIEFVLKAVTVRDIFPLRYELAINPPKNGVYYTEVELNIELIKKGLGCVQSNTASSPEDEIANPEKEN